MIKAVIFDMDGVLLDSQPAHFRADIGVLARCQCSVTQEMVEIYAGMPNPDRWARYKNDFGLSESVEELIHMHSEILNTILDNERLAPVRGVKDLLKKIKDDCYKTAVASSSSREFVYKVLDLADLLIYFDLLVCGEDVTRGKPAPDIFLKAAEKLKVEPSECVIFEDSANGINAAFAAGIKCIGYRNETSGNQDLSKASAVIDSFYDLVMITEYIPLKV